MKTRINRLFLVLGYVGMRSRQRNASNSVNICKPAIAIFYLLCREKKILLQKNLSVHLFWSLNCFAMSIREDPSLARNPPPFALNGVWMLAAKNASPALYQTQFKYAHLYFNAVSPRLLLTFAYTVRYSPTVVEFAFQNLHKTFQQFKTHRHQNAQIIFCHVNLAKGCETQSCKRA